MFSFTPSNLGGNCKTTLVSSHRKRQVACYSFIFLLEIWFVNFSPGLFQEYLFILRSSSVLSFLLSETSKQNVNSVNRLSNSSFFVVVIFPPKTSVPCARARNDRKWREKWSTRSGLHVVMSTVVEQALSYRKLSIIPAGTVVTCSP